MRVQPCAIESTSLASEILVRGAPCAKVRSISAFGRPYDSSIPSSLVYVSKTITRTLQANAQTSAIFPMTPVVEILGCARTVTFAKQVTQRLAKV